MRMGNAREDGYPADGEGPEHVVELRPFAIAALRRHQRPVRGLRRGHRLVTEAERFGWSFVFAGLLPDDFPPTRAVAQAPWWRQVARGRLAPPGGPAVRTSTAARDHPVVHVSWNDARAYCTLGGHPPAHRGRVGVRGPRRPRGQPLPVGRRARARRRAPHERLAGHLPRRRTPPRTATSAPRRSQRSPPTATGCYNITGNVWEWCADWFHPRLPRRSPRRRPARPGRRHASRHARRLLPLPRAPTASATGSMPAAPTPPTPRQATSASGWWRRPELELERLARRQHGHPHRRHAVGGQVGELLCRRRAGAAPAHHRRRRQRAQWIGTAAAGRSSSSARTAAAGSRWPGPSRGPQPLTGSSARSSEGRPISAMPSNRSVSPAKKTERLPSIR